MENRLIKLLFLLLLISIILPFKALGYGANDTHPLLTEAASQIYNAKNPQNSLSPAMIEFLKEGSRAEDEGIRWLFHAYDPIYNRGWFKEIGGLKIGSTSKNWSQNISDQLKYGSHFLSTKPQEWLANFFNPSEKFDNNQTFQKAVSEYLDGNKKSAFYALGHILHLIQDASVPDHTRQNPHIGFIPGIASHYEEFASAFCDSSWNDFWSKIKNQITTPSFSSLNQAFDYIANYSNKNFYSEDTIGLSDYKEPQLNWPEVNGYLMAEDENKNFYHLAKRTNLFFRVLSGPNQYTLNDPLVMNDYFSYLIPKAIGVSASVIDLFFKTVQVEETKNNTSQNLNLSANLKNLITNQNSGQNKDYIFIQESKTNDSKINSSNNSKNSSASNNISSSKNPNTGLNTANSSKTSANMTASKNQTNTTNQSQGQNQNQNNNQTKTETNTKTKSNKEPISYCDFNSQISAEAPVIINEVNWMGSFNSSADEWIELKNLSQTSFDISSWQLINKSGSIHIVFPKGSVIPPNSYFLLERTDDNSAPQASADLIYTGGLRNSDEGLKLFNQNCQKIDEVMADPQWPAGDNSKKLTMERDDDFAGWHTSSALYGTPKSLNSLPYIPATNDSFSSANNNNTSNNQNTNTNNQNNTDNPNNSGNQTSDNENNNNSNENAENQISFCALPQQPQASFSPVILNEIAWMGSLTSPNDEWIELKNLTDEDIDISGWQLINKSQQIKIIFGQNNEEIIIPANGYFLLERTDDNSVLGIPADLIYTGALRNSDEALYLFDNQCELVDFVLADIGEGKNWPAGDNDSKRTMERLNDLSWHTYSGEKINGILGTPKAENSPALKENFKSYVSNFLWHPDLEGTNEVLVEFDTNGYPFIESLPSYSGFWTMMVFYLNQEVPNDDYLSSWGLPQDKSGLIVQYPACRGGWVNRSAIIFPVPNDNSNPPWCSSYPGGARSEAFRRDLIPFDNHYVFKAIAMIEPSGQTAINGYSFSENDYLTLGFYAYDGSMGSGVMKLMLKDNNHYHYNSGLKVKQPKAPENFEVSVSEDQKFLVFSWQELNENISGYRLKYHTPANDFQELGPHEIEFSCEDKNCQFLWPIENIANWPKLNPVTFYFDFIAIDKNGFISEPAQFQLMVKPITNN